MPFQMERMDSVFREGRGGVGGDGPLPSEIVKGRVFGCIFDDLVGLKQRDDVGVDQILFERTIRIPTAPSLTLARLPTACSPQPA